VQCSPTPKNERYLKTSQKKKNTTKIDESAFDDSSISGKDDTMYIDWIYDCTFHITFALASLYLFTFVAYWRAPLDTSVLIAISTVKAGINLIIVIIYVWTVLCPTNPNSAALSTKCC